MDELAAPAGLSFDQPTGRPLLVTLSGECDLAATRALQPEIDALLALPPQSVVIDMRDLTFMDTSGVAVLLRLANHFGSVEVQHANPLITRAIDALGLNERLHPRGSGETQRAFAAEPESIAQARHFIRTALRELPLQVVEVAELLASEVATNALQYSGRDFTVAVAHPHDARHLRISVTDRGAGEPTIRQPDVTAERGRGLQLVDALSERWSVERSAEDGTKTVWFELLAD
jgi:anti-anti-sigma factor